MIGRGVGGRLGKPKEYDPAAEKPEDRTFEPRDYPPAALALIEEALILMLPPEEREARRGFAVISPSLRREHDQRRDAVARRGASRGSPERGPDDGRGEPG